jgi:hypothetical protein
MRILVILLAFALSALPMAADAGLPLKSGRSETISPVMNYCDMPSGDDHAKRMSNCFLTACMAILLPAQILALQSNCESTTFAFTYDRVDLGFDSVLDPPPPRLP